MNKRKEFFFTNTVFATVLPFLSYSGEFALYAATVGLRNFAGNLRNFAIAAKFSRLFPLNSRSPPTVKI